MPEIESPTLPQVAAYVPGRTLAVDDATGTPQNTFSATTRPTDAQVNQLITDAVAWVGMKTGLVDGSLMTAATAVAAVRAAGMVDITWPERDADVNAGQAWLDMAEKMRTELEAANEKITGVDPGTVALPPFYSFPDPLETGWDLAVLLNADPAHWPFVGD
jgi:hypothetical protein